MDDPMGNPLNKIMQTIRMIVMMMKIVIIMLTIEVTTERHRLLVATYFASKFLLYSSSPFSDMLLTRGITFRGSLLSFLSYFGRFLLLS